MNYSIYRFTLDIHKTKSQVSIPVLYHDTGIKFYISLTDGGKPYFIEDGCRAVFSAKKPDGTPLLNDCIIEDNTRIRYDFTKQTTNSEGMMNCEIRLYGKDGKLITTPAFVVIVDPRVIYDSDVIESHPESTTLDHIVASENARIAGEQERVDAEAARVIVENARVAAEAKRVEAENARISEEGVRAASEKTRIANEAERVAAFAHMLGSWVAYSAYEDGTDYTYTWSEGQRYIGICNGKTPPQDKTGFIWSKFVDTGIYIGSGEMPSWCNLQIDPDGEVTEVVQEPGQSDMNVMSQKASTNTFANALKGNASGEAVRVDDVSPIACDMSVKVIGADDVSAVKLQRWGKNLLNADPSKIGRITYIGQSGNTGSRFGYEIHLPAGIYTAHAEDNHTTKVEYYIYGVINTKHSAFKQLVNTVMGSYRPSQTFVIDEGDVLYIYNGVDSTDISYGIKPFKANNIQIELGTTATAYEPYTEPTEYAVNEDGTVDGVTALNPTTTLTTDTVGAIIDVTYTRDANKVVTELISRIAALESAVLK